MFDPFVSFMPLLVQVFVGTLAGWLVGIALKGYGFGSVGNVVIGIVGAVITSNFIPSAPSTFASAVLVNITTATMGATLWLLTLSLVKRMRPTSFSAVEASPPPLQAGADNPAPLQASPPSISLHHPSDVFISYKREERARVEVLAEALRALKLSVWFDARLASGTSFDDEINREVRTSKVVLVCWSRGAVGSEWVRAEASVGRQRGVLAACFLEECEPYTPFNLVHAEHLGTEPLNASNPGWAKIVEQIGQLVGRRGLGAYLLMNGRGADLAAWGAWLADNSSDPLAEVVLARLRAAH